jgi:[ribosomal protein S18]-alanine N-acetyltransferase
VPAVSGGRADRRSGFAARVKASVRPGTPADRAYVTDLGRRTVIDSVAAFRPAPEKQVFHALDRLYETIAVQSHLTLIAEFDGARAGFALFLDELPDEVTALPQGFVAYMAVEPHLRQRGIGSLLLAAAEDEARQRGLPYMSLMVTEDNVAARALYERRGYLTERRLMSKAL